MNNTITIHADPDRSRERMQGQRRMHSAAMLHAALSAVAAFAPWPIRHGYHVGNGYSGSVPGSCSTQYHRAKYGTGKRRARRRRGRGLAPAMLAAAMLILAGCTTKRGTLKRTYPDGSVVELDYHNGSVFGESSTDGVTFTRQGDDYLIEIGPTSNTASGKEAGAFIGGIIEGMGGAPK